MGHDYLVYGCAARTSPITRSPAARCSTTWPGWIGAQICWTSSRSRAAPAGSALGGCAGRCAEAGSGGCVRVRREVVVAVGGQDQKCAALGAGIDDRTATVSLGTASAIEQLMASPATDPAMRIPSSPFCSRRAGCWKGRGHGRGQHALAARRARRRRLCRVGCAAATVPVGSDGVRFYPHLSAPAARIGSPTHADRFTASTLRPHAGTWCAASWKGLRSRCARISR